jgi:hypothetical protein
MLAACDLILANAIHGDVARERGVTKMRTKMRDAAPRDVDPEFAHFVLLQIRVDQRL